MNEKYTNEGSATITSRTAKPVRSDLMSEIQNRLDSVISSAIAIENNTQRLTEKLLGCLPRSEEANDSAMPEGQLHQIVYALDMLGKRLDSARSEQGRFEEISPFNN